MSKPVVKTAKISDLIPDSENGNDGTQRGNWMLEQSIQRSGIGRGIVVDRNLRIIGGNKTHAAIGLQGLEDVIIVPTDGKQLVVTQRTDLDLESDIQARELAWADNRVSEVNFSLNVPQLLADIQKGVELENYYDPEELQAIVTRAKEQQEKNDRAQSHQTSQITVDIGDRYQIGSQVIVCDDRSIATEYLDHDTILIGGKTDYSVFHGSVGWYVDTLIKCEKIGSRGVAIDQSPEVVARSIARLESEFKVSATRK